MPRLLLTDEYWSKLKPIMLESGIYDKPELRLTVEGIHRSIATRYDKLKRNFEGMLSLACAYIWLPL